MSLNGHAHLYNRFGKLDADGRPIPAAVAGGAGEHAGGRDRVVQVHLHERPGWEWPFAETDTHWIALGLHRDLTQAFRIALRNTLDFLSRRAGLSRLDAYALASLAVHFRITQVVDVNQGVHAMIPKEIFARDLRETIRVV